MSDDVLALEDITPTGLDEHPETESVKLHGPPGTGKTTESAARVGRLLRDHGFEVSDVAWCTYRRALAHDTLERFVAWDLLDDAQLDEPHRGATRHIHTTHAVANRCVGELPDPVQTRHKIDFCNRLDIQFLSQESWDETAGQLLFDVFEWMRNNCLDPADPDDVRECPKVDDLRQQWRGNIPRTWDKWCDYKAQEDIIGFHQMLRAPLEESATPGTPIVVVDEYHDATPLMAKLSEFWLDSADIAIVAGDPHQVVNAYDGADPRFFEELELPEVLLDRTYRVPEEHWHAATQILGRGHSPPPVTREGHGTITEYRSPTFAYSDDSGWDVPDPSDAGGPATVVETYGPDTLFLTRMQMQADGIGAALERAGILYRSQTDLEGWNTDSGETRLALFNALQKLRGMKPGHFGRGGGLGRFDEAPRSPEGTELTTREAATLLDYVPAKDLAQTRSKTDDLVDDIESRDRTPTLAELDDWVETEFWTRFTDGATAARQLNKGRLDERDQIALRRALNRYNTPVDPDGIQTSVLTIHASKGQEAEDVVVYDGISRRIRREMRASERTRQNEWRTWYVALTRASDRLHIMRDAFEWTASLIPEDIRQSVQTEVAAGD